MLFWFWFLGAKSRPALKLLYTSPYTACVHDICYFIFDGDNVNVNKIRTKDESNGEIPPNLV